MGNLCLETNSIYMFILTIAQRLQYLMGVRHYIYHMLTKTRKTRIKCASSDDIDVELRVVNMGVSVKPKNHFKIV